MVTMEDIGTEIKISIELFLIIKTAHKEVLGLITDKS